MTSQASDPVRRTSCATDQLGTGMPGVATSAPAPTGDSAGKLEELRRLDAARRLRNWVAETNDGRDTVSEIWGDCSVTEERCFVGGHFEDAERDFIVALENAYSSGLLRQPPQPTGDVGLTADDVEIVKYARMLTESGTNHVQLMLKLVAIIDRLNSRLERSSDPLAWLEDNCCDLRCISLSTGAGDADIGWEVIEHHMAPPKERTIGQGDTPLKAIAMARAILTGPGEEA